LRTPPPPVAAVGAGFVPRAFCASRRRVRTLFHSPAPAARGRVVTTRALAQCWRTAFSKTIWLWTVSRECLFCERIFAVRGEDELLSVPIPIHSAFSHPITCVTSCHPLPCRHCSVTPHALRNSFGARRVGLRIARVTHITPSLAARCASLSLTPRHSHSIACTVCSSRHTHHACLMSWCFVGA
jgi:hypothetical protein